MKLIEEDVVALKVLIKVLYFEMNKNYKEVLRLEKRNRFLDKEILKLEKKVGK